MNRRFPFYILFALFLALPSMAQGVLLGPVACVPTPTSNTSNLGLIKPGHCSTTYDVQINSNMDLLDAFITGQSATNWGFTSSTVINFRNASTRISTVAIDPTTGQITAAVILLGGDPTQDLQAATKAYVDHAVSNVQSSSTVDQAARDSAAAAQSTATSAQTSANSALAGSANDSMARTAAASAQTAATSAQSTATSANNNALSALSGSANDSTARTSASNAQTAANSALGGSAFDSTARSSAASAQTTANTAAASAIPQGTGYAFRSGTGQAPSLVTTIPYSALSGAPTIPTTSSWPNGGLCSAGQYMTGHSNGAIPACSAVTWAQISGAPAVPAIAGTPISGQVAGFSGAATLTPLGTTGSGSVVMSSSPALAGTPTAPTHSTCVADTQVANGAYVAACAASSSSNLPHLTDSGGAVSSTEPVTVNDGSGTGGATIGQFGTAPVASSTTATFWADATAARWMVNNANTGPQMVPGVAVAGTPGNLTKLAANGVDLVDAGISSTAASSLSGTPTTVGDSGAGTSPTITIVSGSTDGAGWISLTEGTSPPSGSSVGIVTIKFGGTYSSTLKCAANPGNAAAAALSGNSQIYVSQSQASATQFVLMSGSTALTPGTVYVWRWGCSF